MNKVLSRHRTWLSACSRKLYFFFGKLVRGKFRVDAEIHHTYIRRNIIYTANFSTKKPLLILFADLLLKYYFLGMDW